MDALCGRGETDGIYDGLVNKVMENNVSLTSNVEICAVGRQVKSVRQH